MGELYELEVINNTLQTGTMCVFQSDPNSNDSQVLSLAWLCERLAPQTRRYFEWTIDYSFVWAETGFFVPGEIFDAAQTVPADLSGKNQIGFEQADGAFRFADQTLGPTTGSLFIRVDDTVPPNQAAVGIGMSGAGIFAAPALPNMAVIFTPRPKYWIAFGDYIAGEVLDVTTIGARAQIAFPPHVYSMRATLADGNWIIEPA